MKKLSILPILTLVIACPAFADITTSNNDPKCDNTTIGAFSGSTELEAQWNANKINLKWYDADGEMDIDSESAPASCTYAGNITLPTPPTRDGYTFDKWVVRAAAAAGFNLSTWNYGSGVDRGYQNDSRGDLGSDSSNTATYGITGDQEWATKFTNGVVKGIASCNNTPGNEYTRDDGWANLPGNIQPGDTFNQSSTGQNCWCKATGVDTTGNGTYMSVSSPSWVFNYDGGADDCAYNCAEHCASDVQNDSGFRSALFGQ